MTEISGPWDGTATGDAVGVAPYDAPSEFGDFFLANNSAASASAHKGGVVNSASGFSNYAASLPGGGLARIASGLGWVQGTRSKSDANVDVSIPTPAAATRVDRIVLRKAWAAQTIRITRIAGTEGAGVPAMTQVFGTTWDVPMWQASITTGGVITLTDERVFLYVPTHAHSAVSDGGPIAHTSLTSIGTNTHAQIDTALATGVTHAAGLTVAAGVHGMQRFNTTGSQSMGTPTDGKETFAKANGGGLTITTPSGSIFVGNTNAGASFAITSGDSYTLLADGTNWHVF